MSPEYRQLHDVADEATSLLKALAHPARLRICSALRNREMSVSEIEQRLGLAQPRLSRELGKLRDEKLVETRRDGKAVHYTLSDERAGQLIDALCGVLGEEPRARARLILDEKSSAAPAASGGFGVFARTKRQ